jgi:Polyketide cyclase / dehydrase and lipid transport
MLQSMTRWYSLEPADTAIFGRAAQVYRFPIRLPVPPARVWESLASDESLAAWGLGVRRLTWTSPRPFGVGTTREVVLPLSSMTVREHFFRWDEGSGYSFYVEAANRPGLRQFAENYVIEPDGDGSLLTWTIALEPKRALAPAMKVLGPVNKVAFGRFATGAKKYFANNP